MKMGKKEEEEEEREGTKKRAEFSCGSCLLAVSAAQHVVPSNLHSKFCADLMLGYFRVMYPHSHFELPARDGAGVLFFD
jgi:hypothetical protein